MDRPLSDAASEGGCWNW